MRAHIEYFIARVLVALLSELPRGLAWWLARFAVRALDLAIPRLRRTAYSNLAFAMPEADAKAITNGIFKSLARLVFVFARFPSINKGNVHEWIEYEGLENFHAAKRAGKGVLIATGHLGNWELSAYAHALMTEPMGVVVRPLDNVHIDRLVETRRALSGNTIIQKRDAARGIVRRLGKNQAVGVLIDQNASLEEGAFVDFFGKPACAGLGFARLANRTGATVIPGFALWSEERNKYVLTFLPPVAMTGDDVADTRQIHGVLEQVIRKYPDQWLWIHRRWKTRPPDRDVERHTAAQVSRARVPGAKHPSDRV